MNLREQIEKVIRKHTRILEYECDNPQGDAADYVTDLILSLPIEGVEMEEKCRNCIDGYIFDNSGSGKCDIPCACQGTGTIRRLATLQEVVDMAKEGRAVVK